MKEFEIEVWYRYMYQGEQEKEFDKHKVYANTPQEAVNKVAFLYDYRNKIPFSFTHENIKYKVNG